MGHKGSNDGAPLTKKVKEGAVKATCLYAGKRLGNLYVNQTCLLTYTSVVNYWQVDKSVKTLDVKCSW